MLGQKSERSHVLFLYMCVGGIDLVSVAVVGFWNQFFSPSFYYMYMNMNIFVFSILWF